VATDEEVASAQAEVAKLRAERESLRFGKGVQYLNEASNDITMTELAAEAARLTAENAELKEANKKASVRAGAAVPLGTAKDNLMQAVALQKATEKAVASDNPGATATATGGLARSTAGTDNTVTDGRASTDRRESVSGSGDAAEGTKGGGN
jgi:hypothetical protein